jgi:lysophospholipase L1-like esterase
MIHAIGDSFTYGDELASREMAWPSLLENMLSKKVSNLGKPATGNHRMTKRTIDAVIDQSELVIIGWSDCNRQEFADEIGIYDIWAGRDYRAFQLQDPTHRVNLIKYMTAYDTPEYYYADWLRQIIMVQSLCKLHKIPCVMFIACGAHNSHRQYYQNFNKLVNAIDHSMFVNDMFTSVAEWTYRTPHGPNGHPLEAGHKIIAEKIYEHIRNKCRIS